MSFLFQCSDEELCHLVGRGDPTAEECLAARYSRLVRVCARPYFLVGGDSEDLLQEGMIGLLSAIRSFDAEGDTQFSAYAETCIRNRIYSAIRSASRGKWSPLNSSLSLDPAIMEEEMGYAEQLQVESPEEALIGKEESSRRKEALAKELSRFEAIVLDRFLEGLSYAQIADLTGKPLKSVDNAVQRIRRKATAYLSSGDNSVS
ncbi:MAG: sigma-70 family RNA polymerase sigma factor [Oscillospiraceae bacterium]|nr:sigma-70 family RNA polymerase sigma factor [Oscillospiraceae bacterium]